MSFKIKNILKDKDSTTLGVCIAIALLVPVYAGMATFADIMPGLVVVVPLLLNGKDENNSEGEPPTVPNETAGNPTK